MTGGVPKVVSDMSWYRVLRQSTLLTRVSECREFSKVSKEY